MWKIDSSSGSYPRLGAVAPKKKHHWFITYMEAWCWRVVNECEHKFSTAYTRNLTHMLVGKRRAAKSDGTLNILRTIVFLERCSSGKRDKIPGEAESAIVRGSKMLATRRKRHHNKLFTFLVMEAHKLKNSPKIYFISVNFLGIKWTQTRERAKACWLAVGTLLLLTT